VTRLKGFIHMQAGAARNNARAAIERSLRDIVRLAKNDQADEEDRQAATEEANKLHQLLGALS
jgi:hypothetical protein